MKKYNLQINKENKLNKKKKFFMNFIENKR